MLKVQNTLGIQIGHLKGHAEGPPSIGALFVMVLITILRMRRPPSSIAPQKITFGEMRSTGVHGVLVYCTDYRCSHSLELSAERWPDAVAIVGHQVPLRVYSLR